MLPWVVLGALPLLTASMPCGWPSSDLRRVTACQLWLPGLCADEVAWLLNLRGADVAYNPVFLSYVIVTPSGATLYIDQPKVTGKP